MAHDFKNFPELTNSQMEIYYFESPHKQILNDFRALVVKVHDGDTITVRVDWRDFDFPVRFIDNNARELKLKKGKTEQTLSTDGKTSQKWLEGKLLNEEVDIVINPLLRVEKWGRLLGQVFLRGIDIGAESVNMGMSVPWANRNDGVIPIWL